MLLYISTELTDWYDKLFTSFTSKIDIWLHKNVVARKPMDFNKRFCVSICVPLSVSICLSLCVCIAFLCMPQARIISILLAFWLGDEITVSND